MISRDGSGWNYGKFDDPEHPRYNFAREVDYCTGACVMVPRRTLRASAASTATTSRLITRTLTWPLRSAKRVTRSSTSPWPRSSITRV